ncbi:MAG: hypothetical protein CVU57_09445 [Deltaproteobacteria bacterium HGW-Deltaproteobacteria-15]|nr:MAG: hypothetical protein CVU57_09445 [Deltaproteobacteria bacterium HGW-Deltaproteobacteria-15]
MTNAPLVDLTSINAIESLFNDGPKDPFGVRLAADFADLFIFSATARYAVTRPAKARDSEKFGRIPQLIRELTRRDSPALKEEPLIVGEQTVRAEHVHDSFESFAAYVLNNSRAIKNFILLHNTSRIRIRPPYQPGLNTGWVFPTHLVAESSEFKELMGLLRVSPEDICHVFDMVLKYSLYGQLAGEDTHYLAHPLRADQNFPTMSKENGPPPPVPFRCGPSIMSIRNLSRDDYTAILHEARGLAHDMKLTRLKPGAIEKERIREFAAKLGLPPRLKETGRALGMIGGIIGGLGALSALGPSAAVAGGMVSIASAFWSGRLPKAITRYKWLHWVLTWDVEKKGR